MLNFLINILSGQSNSRNACGDYHNPNNVIQACYGCDSECDATCTLECASVCVSQAEGHDGSSGNCSRECTGACTDMCRGDCVSLASLYANK